MKLLKSIKLIGGALLFSSGVLMTSCDFLDIVPPEQVGMDDTVKDANETEDFLYSCYANVNNPIQYRNVEASADEFATPQAWGELQHKIAYDLLIPISETPQDWNLCYKYIGQTLLFLEYLPKAQGITEQQRAEYEAEAYFLLAYYHFQVLRMYGPCPITDKRIDPETPSSQYNGRFHYDAVTNWIVKTLDEKVIKGYNLPTERTENTRGRATHAIACALKARVLVYAASPLWNGGFPYKDWRNKISTSLDGVDYGTELVSLTYDPQKWERARVACEEALKEARIAGHKLYEDLEMYDRQNISLSNIYIPGGATDEFKKRVLMLRYLTSSRYNEGNTEYIWGVSKLYDAMACAAKERRQLGGRLQQLRPLSGQYGEILYQRRQVPGYHPTRPVAKSRCRRITSGHHQPGNQPRAPLLCLDGIRPGRLGHNDRRRQTGASGNERQPKARLKPRVALS